MQQAAMTNMLKRQYESTYSGSKTRYPVQLQQQQPQATEADGMLRHVGCQRYRTAMRDYMQSAAQQALEAAQEVDRAVDAFERENNMGADGAASAAAAVHVVMSSAEDHQMLGGGSDGRHSGSAARARAASRTAPSTAGQADAFQYFFSDGNGDTLQLWDVQDEDESDEDGWGRSAVPSVGTLDGGVVAGLRVAAGSTRAWSGSGLTAEQEREAEQAGAEESQYNREADAAAGVVTMMDAVRNDDVGASSLLDLLVRASEEMMSQKRQQQPAGALRPLLLRGGGLVAVPAATTATRWDSGGVIDLQLLEGAEYEGADPDEDSDGERVGGVKGRSRQKEWEGSDGERGGGVKRRRQQ